MASVLMILPWYTTWRTNAVPPVVGRRKMNEVRWLQLLGKKKPPKNVCQRVNTGFFYTNKGVLAL